MLITRRAALGAALLLPVAARAQGGDIGTAARPLRVGVTSGVHGQVLERVRDAVGQQGLVLKITEFGDFIQPNAALAAGDLDVNVYQHRPFLDQQIHDRGYQFAVAGRTVLTAMAVYSRKVTSLADLAKGARIAIPNDPTNGGRALLLLAESGVFKLTPGVDFRASVADIIENPKRVRIVELEAAQIARALDDVDAAAVTGNYAVPAGLDPLHASLAVEKGDSIYCCLVVVRAGDEARPWAHALAAGYADPGVKQWVAETFKGAVVPGA
ncbi:MetQ/NlpA family ABC transporter substrate-binding protein [Limobrevibacterium gyesilva]|uniref:Lipoprotein n=1 Tax=Limobrevibacterium gyesilva TaxID=2991712 RepID=A0AA41YIK9_9PROT|nr:MetQ/NlpA family ABC transporter substrate-binding protein [Limobrevibacterium gyesilva]MCW3474269.1 MetQ/NlpA family ABC transporter substrate-binding protein [Limobrevibacterium gyesilva]